MAPPVYDDFIAGSYFGIVANVDVDQSAKIQQAIDASIYEYKLRLLLQPGIIRCDVTPQMGYGEDYTGAWVSGAGKMYNAEGLFVGTALDTRANLTSPGINIQGGRNAVLENLAIIGPNQSYLSSANPMAPSSKPSWDDTVWANWVDPALLVSNPDADSRYAPLAAITLDAYAGSQPSPHYPTGGSVDYGRNTSSNTLIRRVYVTGYVAGVVSQPSGSDANGDYLKIHDTTFTYCRYGISIGNSQSRNVDIQNVDMTCVAQTLVNNVHGAQHGQFGGAITDLSLNQCGEVFNLNTAYCGAITFNNLYFESTFMLGEGSNGAQTSDSISYHGGKMSFNSYEARGIAPLVLNDTTPSVHTFRGVRFDSFPYVASFLGSTVFDDGCLIAPKNGPWDLPSRLGYNATCSGLIGGGDVRSVRYEQFNVDSGSGSAAVNGAYASSTRSVTGSAYSIELVGRGNWYPVQTYGQPSLSPINYIAKNVGGLVSSLAADLTLTMTFSTYTAYQFARSGPLPGDIVVDEDTGTTFVVLSKASQVITAAILNNYKYDGVTYSLFQSMDLASGRWVIYTSRYYMGHSPLLGTATSGTSVLTVTDGYGSNVTADVYNPVAGDWMAVNPYIDRFADETGAQIDTIDTGAGTYTFTGTNIFQRDLVYPFVLPQWIRWTG